MLKLLRDQFKALKWILWFVVFLFVFFIFVDWGTGRAGSGRGDMSGLAAQVGGRRITETEFLKSLRNTEERYRQMYGKQFEAVRQNLDLAGVTLQGMIDRTLLSEQADRLGIEVSDKELLDKITSFDAFKRSDGSFVGEQLYARILRSNQTSPEEFEASLRQDLTLEHLNDTLAAGIVVTNTELEKEYRKRNESATFELFFLPGDRELGAVTVSDAEAKAYYDANPAVFQHPEQRQLRYLLADDSRVRRSLSVPDAQIAEYYTSHQQEFQASEEVFARHVLIRPKTQDEAGWKAAEALAREVATKAMAPKADFAALAKQYSDDTGSKENGGDLGWFGRSRMVKEFEDAAFALQVGQVSAPVRSQFGYHVIKLEGRRAPRLKPLDEVRDSIRNRLVEGLADGEGSRRATQLREKIDAAKLTTDEQWRTLADDIVTSNVTPFFGKDEAIPGLGSEPDLLTEVGGATEGFVGGPRRTSRGWVVYRVTKVRPAGTTPFDEAKAEAVEAVRRAKAVDIARQKLESQRTALAASTAWADLAKPLSAATQVVTEQRRGAAVPNVGVSSAFEDAVFATPVGGLTPVVKIGDRGAAVARVKAVKVADMQAFAKEKQALRQSIVEEELQRLLGSMLAEARKEQKIIINQQLLERFKPRRG